MLILITKALLIIKRLTLDATMACKCGDYQNSVFKAELQCLYNTNSSHMGYKTVTTRNACKHI